MNVQQIDKTKSHGFESSTVDYIYISPLTSYISSNTSARSGCCLHDGGRAEDGTCPNMHRLIAMFTATRVDNYRPTGVVGVQCGSNVTTLPLASMTDTSTSVLPQLDRNLSLTSQPQSLAPLSDSESNVTGADHDDYTTPAEVRHNDRPGDGWYLLF